MFKVLSKLENENVKRKFLKSAIHYILGQASKAFWNLQLKQTKQEKMTNTKMLAI